MTFHTSNTNAQRLYGLDHLRAMAILLVMVFHFGTGVPEWLEPIRKIGWTGVDLFFVLSGYLIGHQLLKEYKNNQSISFQKFYLKRFFRIIPAYATVLILYYTLPTFREGNGMPPLWRFLTFTQNFGLDAQSQNSFSHAWSLCIEEQFYLLLPLTILAVFFFKIQKRSIFIVSILFILGFALRLYNWYEHVQPFIDAGNRREMVFEFVENVYYPSYNRMDGLLFGFGIAAIFTFRPKFKEAITKNGNIVLLIGIGLLISCYLLFENFISFKTAIFGFPAISLAYAVLLVAALSPGCILHKFKSKLTFSIATLSYSIYLTHKLTYHATKLLIQKSNLGILENYTFWICMITALLVGLALHLIIEKPFLKLRDVVLARMRDTK